ncbi:unnamed protein product, partial [Mesorhabditis spiculigera]
MAAWPSTQNTLHAGTTSGWNDPPTMDNNKAPINSGLNRRQRLVDPSITGVGSQGGYTSAPASHFPASVPQYGQQPQQYVDHHQPQPQGGVGQMSAGTGTQHQPQPHQQSYQM